MEMEKNNKFLGIVGATIGGFIASIPWILMYVYGNMILSVLAILIASGALKGYKIVKAKIDKSLPWIIGAISIIVVIIATLVIIPGLLLLKEDALFNLDNLKVLYSNSGFVSAIIRDLIISIIFTILGISGVFATVRKQVQEGTEVDVNLFKKK